MAETRDVVILGAGHNGLVTAFYLAKAGFKPLVSERRPTVGGCAITEEFHPGFRCSRLAHSAGPMRSDIVQRHGPAEARTEDLFAGCARPVAIADGKPLVLYGDIGKSQQEIAKFSQKDAANYAEFQKPLARIGEVANLLMAMTPPDLEDPAVRQFVGAAKGRPQGTRPGREGPLSHDAMGADGRGRSGRRVV